MSYVSLKLVHLFHFLGQSGCCHLGTNVFKVLVFYKKTRAVNYVLLYLFIRKGYSICYRLRIRKVRICLNSKDLKKYGCSQLEALT